MSDSWQQFDISLKAIIHLSQGILGKHLKFKIKLKFDHYIGNYRFRMHLNLGSFLRGGNTSATKDGTYMSIHQLKALTFLYSMMQINGLSYTH